MNNPHNLSLEERGITPKPDFNEGINKYMSRDRRRRKASSHRENVELRAGLHHEKRFHGESYQACLKRAETQQKIDAISTGHKGVPQDKVKN